MKDQNGGGNLNYLQMLSKLGIGGAHPGGISLTKAIFDQEQFPINHIVLDAGCGTGQTCYYLYQLGYDVIGLDFDSLMIKHAKKRNMECLSDILYLQEDLSSTSLSDQSVDIILCESVLNFTKLENTLIELKRILKQNGVIIAIEMVQKEPLFDSEYAEITSFYGFPAILSIEEWEKVFKQYGLTIFKIQSEDDFPSINIEEPTTEFHITDSTPQTAFDLLSKHEQLTLEYKEKLSYRIFFARLTV